LFFYQELTVINSLPTLPQDQPLSASHFDNLLAQNMPKLVVSARFQEQAQQELADIALSPSYEFQSTKTAYSEYLELRDTAFAKYNAHQALVSEPQTSQSDPIATAAAKNATDASITETNRANTKAVEKLTQLLTTVGSIVHFAGNDPEVNEPTRTKLAEFQQKLNGFINDHAQKALR
jgi:hypothetical protein